MIVQHYCFCLANHVVFETIMLYTVLYKWCENGVHVHLLNYSH